MFGIPLATVVCTILALLAGGLAVDLWRKRSRGLAVMIALLAAGNLGVAILALQPSVVLGTVTSPVPEESR